MKLLHLKTYLRIHNSSSDRKIIVKICDDVIFHKEISEENVCFKKGLFVLCDKKKKTKEKKEI